MLEAAGFWKPFSMKYPQIKTKSNETSFKLEYAPKEMQFKQDDNMSCGVFCFMAIDRFISKRNVTSKKVSRKII